jgi:hypothetical protein
MNVPLVLDRGSVEGEIIWHLTEIEKGLLKKGVLPSEYVGIQLPKIRVTWQQNNRGKGKTKWRRTSLSTSYPPFRKTDVLSTQWRPQRVPGQDWALSGKRSTKWGYVGGHLAAPALWLSCTTGGQLIATLSRCSDYVG